MTTLVAVILWAASHIGRSLILLAIAALLGVALAPAVKIVTRVMSRFLAILVIYLIVFAILGLICYFLIRTVILELVSLTGSDHLLLEGMAFNPPRTILH